MIILITGTPGTGKSSTVRSLSKKINKELISINDLEGIYTGVDEERGSNIVDMKLLQDKLQDMIKGDTIIEGHLSHLLPFGDIVIVLRTHPEELRGRLKERGFGKDKIQENLEAEALDVCLIEALENHREVYEINTTEKSPEETATAITKILGGKTDEFRPGKFDWSEEFF
ncbi:MAG: adenylate kinase family protein [Candidatus Hydrothermarchaeales archaeon]